MKGELFKVSSFALAGVVAANLVHPALAEDNEFKQRGDFALHPVALSKTCRGDKLIRAEALIGVNLADMPVLKMVIFGKKYRISPASPSEPRDYKIVKKVEEHAALYLNFLADCNKGNPVSLWPQGRVSPASVLRELEDLSRNTGVIKWAGAQSEVVCRNAALITMKTEGQVTSSSLQGLSFSASYDRSKASKTADVTLNGEISSLPPERKQAIKTFLSNDLVVAAQEVCWGRDTMQLFSRHDRASASPSKSPDSSPLP